MVMILILSAKYIFIELVYGVAPPLEQWGV